MNNIVLQAFKESMYITAAMLTLQLILLASLLIVFVLGENAYNGKLFGWFLNFFNLSKNWAFVAYLYAGGTSYSLSKLNGRTTLHLKNKAAEIF